jgi:hypothetical protein
MSNKSPEQERIDQTATHKINRAKTARQGTFSAASACRSLSDDEINAWVKKNLDLLKNNSCRSINRHKLTKLRAREAQITTDSRAQTVEVGSSGSG